MKKLSKVTGYVKNMYNGCAFVCSAAAVKDVIFVPSDLAKDLGLQVGATVNLDADESWNDRAGEFGLKATLVYSVVQPKKATAFAEIKWFNWEKGYGIATFAQGDYIGKGVRITTTVAKAAGFSEKSKPGTKMPCKLIFMVLDDGSDELKFEAVTLEAGSDVAKAMKQAIGDKPVLAVVANDQSTAEPVDASQAA